MRASRIDSVLTVRVARMQNLGEALKLEQLTTKFQLESGICDVHVQEATVAV